MQRRNFIKGIAQASICSTIDVNYLFSKSNNEKPLTGTIDNPYDAVDWGKDQHIISTSHLHAPNQKTLDRYYDLGIRHLPISNYYPSVPYYPIESMKENQFMVKQDFGINGPVLWNEIIMNKQNGWYDKLPPSLKKTMPFKEGKALFSNLPKNMIMSANAEHHGFKNMPSLHANSIGSLYSSGNFDLRNQYLTQQHGYPAGTGKDWEIVFQEILGSLLFSDGGGVTINHPVWSGLKLDSILKMLDFDDRVLGIEVYNDTCAISFGDPTLGWAIKLWDSILKTGRRCLGFFVPDHSFGGGRNILVVNKPTDHECLRAYRKGAFYGAIQSSGLRFTNIALDKGKLTVGTNKSSTIRVTTDKGMVLKQGGVSELSYQIPLQASGVPEIRYIRVEANDNIGELIYSQPIRFL